MTVEMESRTWFLLLLMIAGTNEARFTKRAFFFRVHNIPSDV